MHWLFTAVLRFLLWGLWTSGQGRAPPDLDHRGGANGVSAYPRILQPMDPAGCWRLVRTTVVDTCW